MVILLFRRRKKSLSLLHMAILGFHSRKNHHHCSGPNFSVVEKDWTSAVIPGIQFLFQSKSCRQTLDESNFLATQNCRYKPVTQRVIDRLRFSLKPVNVCRLRAQRDRLVTKNRKSATTHHTSRAYSWKFFPSQEDGCVDPNPFQKTTRILRGKLPNSHTRESTIFWVVSTNGCQRCARNIVADQVRTAQKLEQAKNYLLQYWTL